MPSETNIMIDGPAGSIETRYYEPSTDSAPLVVVCHPHPLYQGTMDNKVVHTLVKAFSELGCATVRFNFRGVSDSDGEYDAGMGETEDAMAVVSWARQHLNVSSLWMSGFSFGSFVAARTASLIPTEQLLTVAPAVTRFDFDNLDAIGCPWWVIQGLADEVVDPQSVVDWVDQQQRPIELTTLSEVGHFFHGQLNTLKSLVQQHYQQLV